MCERNMEWHTRRRGPGLQPRHVPWLGIKLVTFWFAGWCPTHWATPVRASTDLVIHLSLTPGRNSSLLLTTHFLHSCYLCLNQKTIPNIVWYFVLGKDSGSERKFKRARAFFFSDCSTILSTPAPIIPVLEVFIDQSVHAESHKQMVLPEKTTIYFTCIVFYC